MLAARQVALPDVQQKDIVLAMFGGAIGLAGLLLIFQGFLVSAYNAPGRMPPAKVAWFKKVVYSTIFVLSLTVFEVGASLHWLLTGGGFDLTVYFFWASLVSIAALGTYVPFKLVA